MSVFDLEPTSGPANRAAPRRAALRSAGKGRAGLCGEDCVGAHVAAMEKQNVFQQGPGTGEVVPTCNVMVCQKRKMLMALRMGVILY